MTEHSPSPLLPYDTATLRFYAEEAPVYTASGAGGVSRHLHAFLDRLKPGARILDLGCGGGRDSEAMLDRGFEVEPTDGVDEIARKAEARLRRSVRVMRFDELDAVERYDAVWAKASLLHVPLTTLPAVLALVFRALKVGGFHFASFKSGSTEGRDRYDRYFNYPSRDALRRAYAEAGTWTIADLVEYEGGGYDGRSGPWIALTTAK